MSEAKGQAILAVETLKKIILDKTKLSVTAPEKVTNETGHSGDVYTVTLDNLHAFALQ